MRFEQAITSTRRTKIIGIAAMLVGAIFFQPESAGARAAAKTSQVAVGAQYGTTHVYVAADDMDRLAASILATFGGKSSEKSVATITPTPSSTNWQALTTPVGLIGQAAANLECRRA
jgi:hypothetical protein